MDNSSTSDERIRLLTYILLESRNSRGVTIDQQGTKEWHRSKLTMEEYMSVFNENIFQNDSWLFQEFLKDPVFLKQVKSKQVQIRNPSIRSNILGKKRAVDFNYLSEHHPFGINLLPLIVSIISD